MDIHHAGLVCPASSRSLMISRWGVECGALDERCGAPMNEHTKAEHGLLPGGEQALVGVQPGRQA